MLRDGKGVETQNPPQRSEDSGAGSELILLKGA